MDILVFFLWSTFSTDHVLLLPADELTRPDETTNPDQEDAIRVLQWEHYLVFKCTGEKPALNASGSILSMFYVTQMGQLSNSLVLLVCFCNVRLLQSKTKITWYVCWTVVMVVHLCILKLIFRNRRKLSQKRNDDHTRDLPGVARSAILRSHVSNCHHGSPSTLQ